MLSIHAQICMKYYDRPERKHSILDAKAEDILRIASEASGISEKDLKGPKKPEKTIIVRHIYCYISHSIAKLLLKAIAGAINRNHASAIHGREKVSKHLRNENKEYKTAFENIIERIALEYEIPLLNDKGRID